MHYTVYLAVQKILAAPLSADARGLEVSLKPWATWTTWATECQAWYGRLDVMRQRISLKLDFSDAAPEVSVDARAVQLQGRHRYRKRGRRDFRAQLLARRAHEQQQRSPGRRRHRSHSTGSRSRNHSKRSADSQQHMQQGSQHDIATSEVESVQTLVTDVPMTAVGQSLSAAPSPGQHSQTSNGHQNIADTAPRSGSSQIIGECEQLESDLQAVMWPQGRNVSTTAAPSPLSLTSGQHVKHLTSCQQVKPCCQGL